MTDSKPGPPVERLFPFVLRSRGLIIGRNVLARSKSRLHFVLVTTDLSPASLQSVLSDYAAYPVVQHFTSGDLEKFFQVKDLRVVGFRKSSLSQSIYAELKAFRLNMPP